MRDPLNKERISETQTARSLSFFVRMESKSVEVSRKTKRVAQLGTKSNPYVIPQEVARRMRSLTRFLTEEKKKRNFRVNFHPSKKVRSADRKLLSAQYWKFEAEPGFWPTKENRVNLATEGGDFMFSNFPQLHGLTVRDYFNPDLVFSMIITVPPIDAEADATAAVATETAPTEVKKKEEDGDADVAGETDA